MAGREFDVFYECVCQCVQRGVRVRNDGGGCRRDSRTTPHADKSVPSKIRGVVWCAASGTRRNKYMTSILTANGKDYLDRT